jgi:serine/threonine protein phosphatase PrpC
LTVKFSLAIVVLDFAKFHKREEKTLSTFSPQIKYNAYSHQGMKRSNNEDSFLVDESLGLYIVCDGMGGHAAGEVASKLAVESIHKTFKTAMTGRWSVKTSEERDKIKKFTEFSILQACHDIFQTAQEDETKRGMGTTISMILIIDNKAFIGLFGDSRCYVIRNQQT